MKHRTTMIDPSVVGMLEECEESGKARPYLADEESNGSLDVLSTEEVGGREIVVISDLHIAAGLDANWRYAGTENFFNDDAFARFIDHLLATPTETGRILVINGDFIDFIRIVRLPDSDDDFEAWNDRLAELGQPQTPEMLRTSIVPKERRYGLRTHDYKSVWRLWRVIEGHPELFAALARWLDDERNRLVILKGNHDLEWLWLLVRNGLRLELARMIADDRAQRSKEEAGEAEDEDIGEILQTRIFPHLHFIDDAVALDRVYIEHGHRYDRLTNVVGKPAETYGDKRGQKQLNIPFGSFFNRYLINRIEYSYPFIDNVRPQESILPLLIRERFPLALRLLWQHVPTTIAMIGKPYWGYVLGRTLLFLLILGVAIGPILFTLLSGGLSESAGGLLGGPLGGALTSLGGLVASYFLSRLFVLLRLKEPSSLEEYARPILEDGRTADGREVGGQGAWDVVTMGHTHNPDQVRIGAGWFFNTGTWIPVVSKSSAELRGDHTFCLLRIERDGEGRPAPRPMERWNDNACRIERLPITHRK